MKTSKLTNEQVKQLDKKHKMITTIGITIYLIGCLIISLGIVCDLRTNQAPFYTYVMIVGVLITIIGSAIMPSIMKN